MSAVIEWIGGGLVVLGGLFMAIGALGLVRMPEVFTRLHAASVSDTFGVSLVLIGLMAYGGLTLTTVKLAFLVLFLALVGPTATHAIARAALQAGVRPTGRDGTPLEIEEAPPSKP